MPKRLQLANIATCMDFGKVNKQEKQINMNFIKNKKCRYFINKYGSDTFLFYLCIIYNDTNYIYMAFKLFIF